MHQRLGTSQRDMPRYDGTRKLIRSVDVNTVAKYEKKPKTKKKQKIENRLRKKWGKHYKNKELTIETFETQLQLELEALNKYRMKEKFCSNCGERIAKKICEKCGWNNIKAYEDYNNAVYKFFENSIPFVTEISLLDQECGFKWINRFQNLVKRLEITEEEAKDFHKKFKLVQSNNNRAI